ncbi:MAG: DUF3618 domain-containing protein [Vicinamibacterales bacterium]
MTPEKPSEAGGTRQIKAEIAQTRADLGETLEALQDRLSPKQMMNTAKQNLKDTATEKVKGVAGRASEAAADLVTASRDVRDIVVERVRANPGPSAALGAGAGLLVVAKAWSSSRRRPSRRRGSKRVVSAFEQKFSAPQAPATGESWGHNMATNDTTWLAADRAADLARRGQNRFQSLLLEHPLAVGLAALAAGLLVGLTLPGTDVENQYLGDTRDTLMEKARHMVDDTIGSTRDAGPAV